MHSHRITPIVLAGGSGTRLWPASREEKPKQFCQLMEGPSLFQSTLARLEDGHVFNAPIIVGSAAHASMIEQQLTESGVEPARIVFEPVGRDTAPAIAAALLSDTDMNGSTTYLVLPSDHAIADEAALKDAIARGQDFVLRNAVIATFGIRPTRPETAFGYIQANPEDLWSGVYSVERFVEKPDRERAEAFLREPFMSWNAGMFLFNGLDMLWEMECFCPEIVYMVRKSIANGQNHDRRLYPAHADFSEAPKISIDHAVMERTKQAVVVPVDPGWSDLGSWGALWDHAARDVAGNVIEGDVVAVNTSRSYVQTDGPMVAVAGVEDIVVVANTDAVLVARREDAQSVKTLVETMKQENRPEQKRHTWEKRPWGRFDSLDRGERHQVKRITVDPGGRLSLQYHHHRSEHWIVVAGTARVTVGEDVMALQPGEQVFIPQGAVHRLENMGSEPVEIIEVQLGSYLGEDDIVRVEDVYGRNQGADAKAEEFELA